MTEMATTGKNNNENKVKSVNEKALIERTFYWEEEKTIYRILTITYIYDRKNKVLSYGASIYRYEDKIPFEKKCHRETAMARLKNRPVIIPNVDDNSSLKDFHEQIRKLIYIHGVKGKVKLGK